MTVVSLVPLTEDDKEQFIIENQRAFKFGALEEFGLRDEHIDDDGEIISRKTIDESLSAKENEAYWIVADGRKAGGVIVKIDKETNHNHLEILFTFPLEHSKGIGSLAWKEIEALYPETRIWETCTPYFEKRNLHFYINKCGFQAVEFFCEYHEDPNMKEEDCLEGPDEMFRFVKVMKE